MTKERLITPGYCFIIAANFLLYFGFYLLMPVFPFYLTEVFHTGSATMGIALSCYTLAALTIRPFSGYLLDTFARKPLYIFAYFIFTSIFAGYIVAGTLAVFIILRVVHGFAFGTVTVSGNTLVIDITPSSRRGEALGYYGLANNIAMSIGPMVGLFMHDAGLSFDVLFVASVVSCSLGLVCALLVRTPVKPQVKREPISLDRFFLVKGIPAGLDLLLLSIPYGMTTTYVAMYARQIGIVSGSGLFFTLMAVGMAVSRLFSGRQVDKGRIVAVISFGIYLVCFCFFGLSSCKWLMAEFPAVGRYVFFGIALLLGVGFGNDVPGLQYAVRESRPQQQARYGHIHLPHVVGRGYRSRVAARRLHRTGQHAECSLFRRGMPDGGFGALFQYQGRPPFRAEQAAVRFLVFTGIGRRTKIFSYNTYECKKYDITIALVQETY